MNRVAEIVDRSPGSFAGYHMTRSGIEVYLASQKASSSATTLAKVAAIARDGGVRLVTKTQPRSAADLQAIEQAVRPDGAQAVFGRSVVGTQIDPQTNVVKVYTDAGSAADLQRRANNMFGGAVRVHAVSVRNGAMGEDLGRTNDSAPWYGGDYVHGIGANVPGSVNCSTAFTLTNAHGQDFMISAGHCIAKGFAVLNGNNAIGTVMHRNFPSGSDLDNELIGGSRYGAFIWIGPGGTAPGQTSIAVHGAANSCSGCSVFLDGAVTGQTIASLAGQPFCARFDSGYACNLQLTNSTRCTGGDSGGPVFAYDGRGGVTAIGIIKGRVGFNCVYTRLPPVLQYWKATIKTPPF